MNRQHVTLVLGLVLLVYCLVVLLTEGAWVGPSRLVTLSSDQIVDYIKKRKFDATDVVLIPPFVMDGDKNLSVVSVLRFMPWFRRLHIYDANHEASRDATEYWRTHQKAKLVFFHQDLLEYSLTSPFLAEHFVILRPFFVLGNYAFVWQFFVDDSPVLRHCRTGVIPMTRTIFNECSYRTTDDKYAYAVQKGLADERIRYLNNADHFVPPCASSPVKTVHEVGAVYELDQVRALFQFTEVAKDRSARPLPLVLAVMASPTDDLTYPLPESHAGHVQVWVHLTELDQPDARLSFTCRMIVSRNVFIEIFTPALQHQAEKIGAEVMKQLKILSRDEAFHVLDVFSHPSAATATAAQRLANDVGNKLARTYSCPFVAFSRDEKVADEREWQRLLRL